MKTVTVIKSGTRSDNSFYALVQKIEGNFILTGFLKTVELVDEGELQIPASIEKAIEYRA